MAEQRTGLSEGEDGKLRCAWHGSDPLYRSYHDDEWGRPVADDRRLYEKICLEGFQSGLSWLTILRKRENFRAAFADFDFAKVADFGEAEIARLLGDAGIIRHRGKIVSTINNARRAAELVAEAGSLAHFVLELRARTRRASGPHRLGHAGVNADHRDLDPPVEGVEEARLELRRSDHCIRIHAGSRPGQ